MKALIIIDIDNHNGWRHEPSFGGEESRQSVASAIEKTLCQARSASIPIIFVVFPYGKNPERGWKNRISSEESQRHLPAFLNHRRRAEPIFFKVGCDAFRDPCFAEKLRAKGIDKLLMAGCDTPHCVQQTVFGAAREGFEVYILEECIYPRFAAEKEKVMWLHRMNGVLGSGKPTPIHMIQTIDA